MKLTPEQKSAVEAGGHTLASACPGAGKTRVLSLRAAHVLNAKPEHRVVAVTFTRDSASELESRIQSSTPNTKGRLIVGTFHSLCLRQIKRTLLRRKRLIGGGEQFSIIKRAIQVAGLDGELSMEDAQECIAAFKSAFNPRIGNTPEGELYRTYQRILARENLVDFSDLIILAVMGMKDGTVAPYPTTHLLVDESQDMDEIQYAWVKHHAENGVITTLVGDDDQSIYGWRHALGYEGLIRFRTEFSAQHITLAHNFRCDQKIVHHAGKLIAHNRQRVEKDFICTSSAPGSVETKTHYDEMAQADGIAELTLDGRQWAVLARTNKVLDLIELAFMSRRIPYVRVGGSSLWDRDVAAIYLAFLESLADNHSSGIGTVLHWAGVPDEVMAHFDPNRNLSAALEDIQKRLKGKDMRPQATFVRRVRGMIPQWQSLIADNKVSLVCGGVAILIEDFVSDYKKRLLERASFVIGRLSGTLKQRIAFVKRKRKEPESDQSDSKVTLLTMHASKGLEYECVSVASCVEGVVPHTDSPLDEERRLMYVAMTRAKHRLVLHSFLMDADGETSMTKSRFIQEAGLS